MKKSFSSNNSIDNLRWDIANSRGRKQKGLISHLSNRDSFGNKDASEKFIRYLTNSSKSYLLRIENIKDMIYERGFDNFSNFDLSYFSENLDKTGKYVESLRGKSKEIVHTDSVIARINGLKRNIESVLSERKEKKDIKEKHKRIAGCSSYNPNKLAIMELKAAAKIYDVQKERRQEKKKKLKCLKEEIRKRLDSEFYNSKSISNIENTVRERRTIKKQEEKKEYQNWTDKHPIRAFFSEKKRKIAAGFLVGTLAVLASASYAPVIPQNNTSHKAKVYVSLADKSKKSEKDSKVSIKVLSIKPNESNIQLAMLGSEQKHASELSVGLARQKRTIGSGGIEEKVESILVEEKKGPGLFAKVKKYLGKNIQKARKSLTRLKNTGSDFAIKLKDTYEISKERIANINKKNNLIEYNPKNDVENAKDKINAPHVTKEINELIGKTPTWWISEGERNGRMDPRGLLNNEEWKEFAGKNGNILEIRETAVNADSIFYCKMPSDKIEFAWGGLSLGEHYDKVKAYLRTGYINWVSIIVEEDGKNKYSKMIPLKDFLESKDYAKFRYTGS